MPAAPGATGIQDRWAPPERRGAKIEAISRFSAIRTWACGPTRLLQGLAWILMVFSGGAGPGVLGDVLPQALAAAQETYASTRLKFHASPAEAGSAWQFARACFDLADYSTNDHQRAKLAEEGIAAARADLRASPDSGPGHFYLALNLAQLARTKGFGALSLIREMEKSFLRAIELDPHLARAGPDRSLGMLYLDAPGWPVSIGSKRKAREHLERAVSLEPDYPDNHLSLLEARVRWREKDLLVEGAVRYLELLPEARKKYTGAAWEQSWHDWDERWQSIRAHAGL